MTFRFIYKETLRIKIQTHKNNAGWLFLWKIRFIICRKTVLENKFRCLAQRQKRFTAKKAKFAKKVFVSVNRAVKTNVWSTTEMKKKKNAVCFGTIKFRVQSIRSKVLFSCLCLFVTYQFWNELLSLFSCNWKIASEKFHFAGRKPMIKETLLLSVKCF